MKKLRVTVDGKTYEVLVEEVETTTPAAQGGAPLSAPPSYVAPSASVVAPPVVAAAPASSGPAPAGAVVSPLAGRVVSVDCSMGQTVASGDKLVTLEAMKMNTYVYADRGGVVSALHAQAGDGVEEGQALVSIT